VRWQEVADAATANSKELSYADAEKLLFTLSHNSKRGRDPIVRSELAAEGASFVESMVGDAVRAGRHISRHVPLADNVGLRSC